METHLFKYAVQIFSFELTKKYQSVPYGGIVKFGALEFKKLTYTFSHYSNIRWYRNGIIHTIIYEEYEPIFIIEFTNKDFKTPKDRVEELKGTIGSKYVISLYQVFVEDIMKCHDSIENIEYIKI